MMDWLKKNWRNFSISEQITHKVIKEYISIYVDWLKNIKIFFLKNVFSKHLIGFSFLSSFTILHYNTTSIYIIKFPYVSTEVGWVLLEQKGIGVQKFVGPGQVEDL